MNIFVLWFVKLTGIIPQFFYFRKKIYYEDKKVQSRKIKNKAIIISNHTSIFDFVLYMFVFFGRNIYALAAELLFKKNKALVWLIKRIGTIKVDRNNYDFGFMVKSIDLLNKGKVIEIYPESRLPKENEHGLLEFKPSYVSIALESGAPIIPVYTNGSYGKKQRAKVIIGKPINLVDMYDNSISEKENIEKLNNYVKDYIKHLGEMLHEKDKEKNA